ncbi:hypothetical protein JCM3765_006208 [Sporobolomyces pararoseus]
MASVEETFYSAKTTGGSSTLTRTSGLTLDFVKATVDLTLPSDGTSAIPPERFKLTWEVSSTSPLNHKLDRIVFDSGKARFLIPLPDLIPLKGVRGEVPFSSAASSELVSWKESLKGSSIVAQLVFRRLPKVSETESEDAVAIRTITQHAQNDVLFLFPSNDRFTPPRYLWSKSSLLIKSSPYFKTFFETDGFVKLEQKIEVPDISIELLEGRSAQKEVEKLVPSTPANVSEVKAGTEGGLAQLNEAQVQKQTEREKPIEEEEDEEGSHDFEHEDSDIENDYYPTPSTSPSIHRLVVRDIAYKTLFSYLYYLETGKIHFSSLSSLLPPSYVPPTFKTSSTPSCSAKSMYFLLDVYEHQTLRELAYNFIASQLDWCNALLELFSDLAATHEEIKGLCMQAVLDNWNYIKDSKQMKEVEEDLRKGNLEERKVGLMFELFSKLKPASS